MVWTYLIIIGIISFITLVLYAFDKHQSKVYGTRIPEKILLAFTVCGGGIGAFLGMLFFRHKTKKIYFQILMFLSLTLDIALFFIGYIFIGG